MNTYVSNRLENERIKDTVERTMRLQNDVVLGSYFEAAKETANECDVEVCDVYSKWKKLSDKE